MKKYNQQSYNTKKRLFDPLRLSQNDNQFKIGKEIVPNAHRVASLLERWLLGTHQNHIENKYLQYYLDKFVFRHIRRKAKKPWIAIVYIK